MSPPDRYSMPAVVLHWIIAILIIGLIVLGYYMVDIPRNTPDRAFYFNLHKSFGITAAIFIAAQIVWHFTHRAPALPVTMAGWETKATHVAHGVLYLLMVAVPISGYLSSSFSKYGVHLFGLKLPHWGWDDQALRDMWVSLHSIISMALVALVVIHVLAALKHALMDRDGVMKRMLP